MANHKLHRTVQFIIRHSAFLVFLLSPGLYAQGIPLHAPVPETLGVNIHTTNPVPGEVEEMAEAGIHWVRTDFSWSDTEPKPGHYDFSAYDRLLAALDVYHIRALLILDYTNKLYDHGLSPDTDAGRRAFADWAVAAARHFRGRGVVWEMYNEPNGGFWKPRRDDANYIRLAMAVGEALKENAPGSVYIGPASAGIDLAFLRKCFQAGLLHYWSAVSVHPYRLRGPETAAPVFAALRKMIAAYAPRGATIPIIAGEWGYSGTWLWPGMNNELQAELLAREFLSDIADSIPLTIWYDWHDDGLDPRNQESTFGLVEYPYRKDGHPAFTPKPAYDALKTLARTLGGYTFKKRATTGTQQDYILLFTKGSERRLVAWTEAWQPQPIAISGASGRFVAVGVQGKTLRRLRARRSQLTVTLTDAPVYLLPQSPGGLKGL
ncbi:MAG: beta-galactosidase [Terriglobia bacterium]